MGKRQNNQQPKNVAAHATADKGKRGGKKPQNPEKASAAVPAGPVPIRKVPSLRGKNKLELYAAGGMARAPSPGLLPPPPAKWTKAAMAAATSSEPMAPPPPPEQLTAPPVLQRESSVVAELQGNLLYLTLSPLYPELAGKIVGMLLELGPEDMTEILGNAARREAAVKEALEVLRAAGDERALALAAPSIGAAATSRGSVGGLCVDIGAAQAAQAASDVSSGLTPSLTGLSMMRMSPRVSGNPYQTMTLLSRGSSFGAPA